MNSDERVQRNVTRSVHGEPFDEMEKDGYPVHGQEQGGRKLNLLHVVYIRIAGGLDGLVSLEDPVNQEN